jgi:hypothetical protein
MTPLDPIDPRAGATDASSGEDPGAVRSPSLDRFARAPTAPDPTDARGLASVPDRRRPCRPHAIALLLLVVATAVNMGTWFSRDLLPPDDFAGYASVVEEVRDTIRTRGVNPLWCTKWFAGTTCFMSRLKEIATLPLALAFDPVRATKGMFVALKLAAALAMYGLITRLFAAPVAGVVAGYAYGFSMHANYTASSGHLDVAVSSVLFPLIFLATVEALGSRRGWAWTAMLGALGALQWSNNYLQATMAGAMASLVAVLCPIPTNGAVPTAGHRPSPPGRARMVVAAGIFALLACAQTAWWLADGKNHALYDPEHVEWAQARFIEHSPFVYVNRGNWLGPWLARHHPPDMPLFPGDPLRNQRHYLGGVALLTVAIAWRWARATPMTRHCYRILFLLLLLQTWLARGPNTLVWQLGRSFTWPEQFDGMITVGCVATAMVILAGAAAVLVRRRGRVDATVAIALALATAATPGFEIARRMFPIVAQFRAPGHFFDLAPFSLYALLGIGLAAIERHGARSAATYRGAIAAIGCLVAIDLWPGTAAFARGTPYAPLRDFRSTLAALPSADGTLRVGWSPWTSTESWRVASLVVTAGDVGATWSWLEWQAGRHWPDYWRATTLWLAPDVAAEERSRLRAVGDVLARIGRVKYFLVDHAEETPRRLPPPWRLRHANARFGLWERPDVAAIAEASHGYVLLLSDSPWVAAETIARAAAYGALVVANTPEGRAPSPTLVDGAAAIVTTSATGVAVASGPVLERRRGQVVVVDEEAPDLRALDALLAAAATAAAPAPPPVTYARPAPTHIRLVVDAGPLPVVVSVSEAEHPWWHVSIDGVPADRVRTQMTFLGAHVPAGRHVVEFALRRPPLVAAADAVTTIAWVALLIGAARAGFATRRRARRPSATAPLELAPGTGQAEDEK